MDILEGLLLKKDFPHLDWNTFAEKSEKTVQYNCVAFAVGDTSRRWWPNADGAYWPSKEEGVPQEETVQAFIAALGTPDIPSAIPAILKGDLKRLQSMPTAQRRCPGMRPIKFQTEDGRVN